MLFPPLLHLRDSRLDFREHYIELPLFKIDTKRT